MSELLIGLGQVDYTPQPGLPLMGNFRDDYAARGVHDPLCAKAAVFKDGAGRRAALLSVDICMLDRENVAFMRDCIASQCELRPEEVLITATHTHSAPAPMVLGSLPRSPDEDVRSFLRTAASAAVRACEDLRPASLAVGYSREHRVSFNRRLQCRDGRTRMNWERLDPQTVVAPLGPINPQLTVVPVIRDGRAVGALVNFALHPAILAGDNWLYSADFPGYWAEGLSRLHGGDFVTVFLNAPCGDVNHLDYRDPLQGRGFQMTQRVGYMLAVAAQEALRAAAPVKTAPVAVTRETVALQRLPISEEERRWCERVIAEVERTGTPGQVDGLPEEFYARTRLRMHARQHEDDTVEVMTMRVGDVAFVGLPGEIFCELGMDVTRHSAAPHTLVMGLSNDAIGYIPTRAAYPQGGYEVTPGATLYRPGCGEALVESAVRQLAKVMEQ